MTKTRDDGTDAMQAFIETLDKASTQLEQKLPPYQKSISDAIQGFRERINTVIENHELFLASIGHNSVVDHPEDPIQDPEPYDSFMPRMINRRAAAPRQPRTGRFEIGEAVGRFEKALPGWWWTIGTCSVSRHASCGPDFAGPDFELLRWRLFDDGFHADLHDPDSTVADALMTVMSQALKARRRHLALKDKP